MNDKKMIIKSYRIENELAVMESIITKQKKITENDLRKILFAKAFRFIDINKPLTFEDRQKIDIEYNYVLKVVLNGNRQHLISSAIYSGDSSTIPIQ